LLSNASRWYGSLDVDFGHVAQPTEVIGLQGRSARDIACGLFHTLFLVEPPPAVAGGSAGAHDVEEARECRVLACGNNDAGQLGLGHRRAHVTNRSPQVVEALMGERVVSVHAGWEFSLALLEGGTVVGWGWNTYGQVNPMIVN
jgi:alpha-tubulin suppressor-like RCC1 family protein